MFEVERIAKLARLGLGEDEKSKFQKDLTAILAFVEKLKEAEAEKVDPMAQIVSLQNVTRIDEARSAGEDARRAILANAPKREGDYFKAKAIFD